MTAEQYVKDALLAAYCGEGYCHRCVLIVYLLPEKDLRYCCRCCLCGEDIFAEGPAKPPAELKGLFQ